MNVYLIHDKILAESKKVPRPVRAQPREGRPQTQRAPSEARAGWE